MKDCYYGIYKAFVHNVDDPETRGRLMLRIPQFYDEPYEYWALPAGMYSGKGIGTYWLPNVGDPIWVMFENGDPRFPVWQYGWLRKDDAPEGASPTVKVLQTTSEHRIEIDEDNTRLRILDKAGNIFVIDGEKGVSIISDNISLGTNEKSAEKAAMGETLKTKLEQLIDAILAITVQTPSGPSIPNSVVNAPQFQQLKQSLGEILSTKVTLDKQ